MTIRHAFTEIQKLCTGGGEELIPQLNEKQVLLSPECLLPAVATLQKNGVYHLSTITGVYDEEELYLLYHFWAGEGITLRVRIDQDRNEVDTLTQTIPGALFYEREIAEMFAIRIKGLDTSEKMFLPDNWNGGAPMRKEAAKTDGKDAVEEE